MISVELCNYHVHMYEHTESNLSTAILECPVCCKVYVHVVAVYLSRNLLHFLSICTHNFAVTLLAADSASSGGSCPCISPSALAKLPYHLPGMGTGSMQY